MFEYDKSDRGGRNVTTSQVIRGYGYTIGIDYLFDMKDNTEVASQSNEMMSVSKNMFLCLFDIDECVSPLSLDFNDETKNLEISSKTKESYERRNLNKFLRAIVIIIARFLYHDVENVMYSP